MIVNRLNLLRFGFSTNPKIPTTAVPKAPKLFAGELNFFRYDAENARIFDGYNLDELYGSKIGFKHSPAMRAEMRK
jgi:hypothetical protein